MAAQLTQFILLLSLLGSFFLAGLYSPIAYSQLKLISTDQKRYPIENNMINESSGLACSTRDKKVLWTHNDSGHMPIIYAMDVNGNNLGAFHLEDIINYDWEDMDAFEYQGKHYLLIADTGDNSGLRWDARISILIEPELPKKKGSAVSPLWSFVFRYEDGQSHDVESVAVDITRKKIILLTKRTDHALMFELPLKPLASTISGEIDLQTAVKVGEFKDIVNPSALDISANGQLMSINTYRRIHRFRRRFPSQQDGQWKYENSLKYNKLFQPEAMCLVKDKKHYYITSEKQAYLLKLNNK